ncbi:PH domain-containing protein [Williamsia sp. 1138]|uniref:PH domain-containing protein n=1 Tax=Williamsia sp. 1138 TaxID=1903117 RepID=UPI001FED334A|nr:PH domain-containing protein [Williamsia sp. 1138]
MSEPQAVELPAEFRIHPIAYFAVFMMGVSALVLAGVSLPYLGWTLALPIVVAIWVRRLRTIVTEDGVTSVTLRGRRSATWDQISGLQFPRWGAVRAVLDDKSHLILPAISFRDLPRLSAASRGRIPDPYAIDSPDAERIDVDAPPEKATNKKAADKSVPTSKSGAAPDPAATRQRETGATDPAEKGVDKTSE